MGCKIDPISIVEDVALTAIGQPELIPLANAGTAALEGKGLKGALLAGGESLLGQEVAGAFGVGEGNSIFNNAFGITGDNPASLGLPDLGQMANNAIGGVKDGVSNLFGGGSSSAAVAGGAGGDVISAGSGTPTSAVGQVSAPISGGTVSPLNLGAEASNQINAIGAGSSLAGESVTSPTSLGTLSGGSGGGSVSDLFTTAGAGLKPDAAGLPDVSTAVSNIAANGSPTAGASGGFLSGIKDALPSGSKALAAAVPLGSLAYQAIKGPPAPTAEQRALGVGGSATAPLLATEKQSLDAYNSGQISPAAQMVIAQEVQSQQNALLQQLASSGVTNPKTDSRYVAGMENIRKNAIAMMQSALQQELQAGTSAAGAAGQNLHAAAQEQLSSDAEFQQALNNAFGSLGSILAGTPQINLSTPKAA